MLKPLVAATYITATTNCQSHVGPPPRDNRPGIAPVCSRPTTKARAAGKLPQQFSYFGRTARVSAWEIGSALRRSTVFMAGAASNQTNSFECFKDKVRIADGRK